MKLHNIKKMVILFSGESVHHSKDRGGLEFNAGERGEIHRDEGDKDAMQNERDGLEDHEGSWR